MPVRYTSRGILLRVLTACLVVGAALGAKELFLGDEFANVKTAGARVLDFELESKLIGETVPVTVVVPKGAADGKRALLIFLHGRDGDENSYRYTEMFRALQRQKGKAPVVAFPGGDPDAYWHDREQGMWGSVISRELVPRLVGRFDIEPERVGIAGISMGGFGAFNIARQDPELFCTAGGHSAAAWIDGDDTAPGAFDDREDFDANDVIRLVGPEGGSPLDGKRVWLDVGDEDPFLEADRALNQQLAAGGASVKYREGDGGHESSYWRQNWRRYFGFYAKTLKACQVSGSGEDSGDGDGSPTEGDEAAADESS